MSYQGPEPDEWVDAGDPVFFLTFANGVKVEAHTPGELAEWAEYL